MYGDGKEFDLNEWVFNTEAHPLKITASTPAMRMQTDALHHDAPDLSLQEHQPNLQQQQAEDASTDVVDASLADAVADEDRANLNTLHDTLDRATNEITTSTQEAGQQ